MINIYIDLNCELLRIYEDNNRSIEYSIEQLLNSIPKNNAKLAFEIYSYIKLKSNTEKYKINDELISKIKKKYQSSAKIDNLVNTLAWIAFLFPEI